MAGIFTDEQRELMKDLDNEFRLETTSAGQWKWYRIYSYKFRHEKWVPGTALSVWQAGPC